MKLLPLIFIIVLIPSCLNQHGSSKVEANYLISFKLIHSYTPNPDAAVFRIHTDYKLRELLISEKWDSIRFFGGLFDTIDFNRPTKIISIAETNIPNELTMAMITYLSYTQSQLDSIALETFDKVEVNVYFLSDVWKLKPLGKNRVRH